MMANENMFYGIIDLDGNIFELNGHRKGKQVGVDLEKEQDYIKEIAERDEIIENYYNKLVEIGVIVPPKTAEQIAIEQADEQREINKQLLQAITGLQSELKSLKGKTDNEPIRNSDGTFAPANGKGGKKTRQNGNGAVGSDNEGKGNASRNNGRPNGAGSGENIQKTGD
jgi:hypothetical protein